MTPETVEADSGSDVHIEFPLSSSGSSFDSTSIGNVRSAICGIISDTTVTAYYSEKITAIQITSQCTLYSDCISEFSRSGLTERGFSPLSFEPMTEYEASGNVNINHILYFIWHEN